MKKEDMKAGVVVIKLTATVYLGENFRTYTSRIGFAGEFNDAVLAALCKDFKELYAKDAKARCEREGLKPDKIVCRASSKATECQLLLDGK